MPLLRQSSEGQHCPVQACWYHNQKPDLVRQHMRDVLRRRKTDKSHDWVQPVRNWRSLAERRALDDRDIKRKTRADLHARVHGAPLVNSPADTATTSQEDRTEHTNDDDVPLALLAKARLGHTSRGLTDDRIYVLLRHKMILQGNGLDATEEGEQKMQIPQTEADGVASNQQEELWLVLQPSQPELMPSSSSQVSSIDRAKVEAAIQVKLFVVPLQVRARSNLKSAMIADQGTGA